MDKFENHTFVVCAYKESPYLEECIRSLLNQNVKSNIIMSTSTPNEYIKNIAKTYNLKLYINTGKSGIGEDWNFGVSNTTTDYVTIAHQDDVYKSNYLEEIVKKLNNGKDFVIAFSDYREIKNGKEIELTKNLKIKEKLLSPLKFFPKATWAKRCSIAFGNGICCPSVTLNTKIVGKTPFKVGLKSNVDWETWYEMSKFKGRFLYIPKELMDHRIHEGSETSNLIENNVRLEEDLYMFEKFWPKFIAKKFMNKYKDAVKTNKV